MKKIACILSLILSVFIVASSEVEATTGYINGPSYIQKEQYSILSLSDILSFYTYSDLGIGIVEDNYSGNGATLGVYNLTLNSGETLKTIEIEVLKSIGYGVRAVTDNKNIHINKSIKLNPIDIANIHNKTGVVNLNYTSQMSVLTDNYSAGYDTPGVYTFEYRLLDAAGVDITVGSTITVYESDRLENPILIKPESNSLFANIEKVISILVLIGLILGIIYIALKIRKKVRP